MDDEFDDSDSELVSALMEDDSDSDLVSSLEDDPAQAALMELLQPESPANSDGAVPYSPRLSEPDSPAEPLQFGLDVKPLFDDLSKIKDESDIADWSIFDPEPLEGQVDDQFLLFPQLVL